jgi:hypothetical protein
MAPDSNDMPDLDRPVTRRELRAELQELRSDFRAEFATKADLRSELAAMRSELRTELATKTELHAMKADLQAATEGLRTEMSTGFAEMRAYVDFSVKSVRDELRTHFDVVAESLRADIANMIDWLKANINGMTTRVDGIETGHGARLTDLEMRTTRLEADQN